MKRHAFLPVVLAALSLGSFGASAQLHTLYAASVRSGGVNADIPIAGNLYTINLASGTATLVGAIRLAGKPIGITGMAVHPKSGVFYGITSEQSPHHARSLVTLDPATGAASLVGELGVAGSDIAFDQQGTLYMWLPASTQIGTVNTSTAAVAPLGKPGPGGSPAGIAIDISGMIFVTAKGATGTLDNVDLVSGTINTATGAVSTIGALPDDTDALAFTGQGFNFAPTLSTMSPGGRVVIAVVSAVLLVLAGMLLLRQRKQ
jgi:hypothetical protein